MELTADQAFQLAMQLQGAGRVTEAEKLYRELLKLRPDHPDLLHLFGLALVQTGRREEGMQLIRQAIAKKPGFSTAWNNLGIALEEARRPAEAIAAFREALKAEPNYAHALNNLGNALRHHGESAESVEVFRRLIALHPTMAEGYSNFGASLRATGDLDAAVEACRKAISLNGRLAAAHVNLGTALLDKGAAADAVAALRRGVELQPDLYEGHHNLGSALQAAGLPEEAVTAFQRAAELRPHSAETLMNLGASLHSMGRMQEAEAALRRAVAANPAHAPAHSNLLYAMPFMPQVTSAQILTESRQWDARHGRGFAANGPYTNDRTPDRPLRIAYLSPDFRAHVVGRNLLPLFRERDRSNFHVTCYSNVLQPDDLTREFQQMSDDWRDIRGASDDAVAELIRRDRIDVLIDLSLHMSRNRLRVFARKPAPLQITFAGYPGTTGLAAIDYRLTDPYLDPPGQHDELYAEKTIRLPHSFWCYAPNAADPEVGPLPADSNGLVTFGCLNSFSKVNEQVLALWAPIFRTMPSARLRVLAAPGKHRDWLLSRLELPPNRVDFLEVSPRERYLREYGSIDVALDTFPYNGHTTSLDALWMGVPVVTLCGDTVVSKAGFSQLSNLGLHELVANSPEQFVSIATGLATDTQRLRNLRQSLRERMCNSPLMNARDFAKSIEAAYRHAWQQWCASSAAS